MATVKQCSECKTEIKRTWRIAGGHLVGKCPNCRKMVNFGKADSSETSEERQPAAASAQKKTSRKSAPASRKPAGNTPGPAAHGAAAKPGGSFLDRVFGFLAELDAD